MSMINKVREAIDGFDGKQFTINDMKHICTKDSDYKAIGTALYALLKKHREIVEVGKGDKSTINGRRANIYESCEPPPVHKKTFADNLHGWRQVYPEYFRGV